MIEKNGESYPDQLISLPNSTNAKEEEQPLFVNQEHFRDFGDFLLSIRDKSSNLVPGSSSLCAASSRTFYPGMYTNKYLTPFE